MPENTNIFARLPDYLTPSDNPPLRYMGPTGFHWLISGKLGGTPRPGIVRSIDSDLEALQRMGTRLLITLTEKWSPPIDRLRDYGIDSYHLKIADMGVPTPDQAKELCQLVDSYLQEGKACVYHCRAGQGRTGTMLAAQLIYYGMESIDAITEVRANHAKWIESHAQEDFLHTLSIVWRK